MGFGAFLFRAALAPEDSIFKLFRTVFGIFAGRWEDMATDLSTLENLIKF